MLHSAFAPTAAAAPRTKEGVLPVRSCTTTKLSLKSAMLTTQTHQARAAMVKAAEVKSRRRRIHSVDKHRQKLYRALIHKALTRFLAQSNTQKQQVVVHTCTTSYKTKTEKVCRHHHHHDHHRSKNSYTTMMTSHEDENCHPSSTNPSKVSTSSMTSEVALNDSTHTATTSTSSTSSKMAITQPCKHDVLFGRGKSQRDHPGNRLLRELCAVNRAVYDVADRDDKTDITRTLVEKIKGEGGHFLKYDKNTKVWILVTDEVAREKVSHMMRDGRVRPLGSL